MTSASSTATSIHAPTAASTIQSQSIASPSRSRRLPPQSGSHPGNPGHHPQRTGHSGGDPVAEYTGSPPQHSARLGAFALVRLEPELLSRHGHRDRLLLRDDV